MLSVEEKKKRAKIALAKYQASPKGKIRAKKYGEDRRDMAKIKGKIRGKKYFDQREEVHLKAMLKAGFFSGDWIMGQDDGFQSISHQMFVAKNKSTGRIVMAFRDV